MPPLFDLPDWIALAVISAEGAVLVALVALIGHIGKRVSDLEASYASLWRDREADAITKRTQGDHIDILEAHIWARKPPPPPPRPAGG